MISDPVSLSVIGLTFLLAGSVKGVIGLGLPTVSLAILAIAFDLTSAMAMLLLPSFVTNLWQAIDGARGLVLLRRLRVFLVSASLAIGVGAIALHHIDLRWLSALLGILLVVYATFGLSGFSIRIDEAKQDSQGMAYGMVNGLLTGMTGSFVVPGVIYLQAIKLTRDELVQAMGMLFTLSTLVLGVSLLVSGLLSVQLGLGSALGLVPAMVGMALGQRIRRRLSEKRFRQLFFIGLLGMGIYLALASLFS